MSKLPLHRMRELIVKDSTRNIAIDGVTAHPSKDFFWAFFISSSSILFLTFRKPSRCLFAAGDDSLGAVQIWNAYREERLVHSTF